MTGSEGTIYLLDMRGLLCPVPVARTRKAARRLPAGALIRVECTDPLADIDIPHMAKSDGHDLLDKGVSQDVRWYLIRLKS